MNMSVFLPLVILTFLSFKPLLGVKNVSQDEFDELYNKLFGNYRRHVRPIANQLEAVKVTTYFFLVSVPEVDEVRQQISVMGVVICDWMDINLVWNPDDYGGIDEISFSPHDIWKPTLSLEDKTIQLFDMPTQTVILSDGQVSFATLISLRVSCGLTMTDFPFDYQKCSIFISNLRDTQHYVDIVPGLSKGMFSGFYVENGGWDVYNILVTSFASGRPGIEFASMKVTIYFQRRSIYYVLNVILPVTVLAALGLVTFAVPVDSGERLSYSLTTLLALSVYIPYIGSIMPKSSMNLPIVLKYMISLFFINVVCVIFSVLTISVRWSKVEIENGCRKVIKIWGLRVTLNRERRFNFTSKLRSFASLRKPWHTDDSFNEAEPRGNASESDRFDKLLSWTVQNQGSVAQDTNKNTVSRLDTLESQNKVKGPFNITLNGSSNKKTAGLFL